MNACLRKEVRQIAPWILLASAALGCAAVFAGPLVIELGPPRMRGHEGLRRIAALYAALGAWLGYFQVQVERMQRTEGSLAQRAGGLRAALRAKCAAAWLALVPLALLPLAAFAATRPLLDAQVGVARWSVLRDLPWVALVFVPGHALGLLVASLRTWPTARFLIGVAGVGALLWLAASSSRPAPDATAGSLARYAAAIAAASAALLAAAHALYAPSDERDLPLRGWRRALAALTVLVLGVQIFDLGISRFQDGAAQLANALRPSIYADRGGEVFLARKIGGATRRVDGRGEAITDAEPVELGRSLFRPDAPTTVLYDHERTPLSWSQPSGDPQRPRVRREPFLFQGSWQHVEFAEALGSDWQADFNTHTRELLVHRKGPGSVLERTRLTRPEGEFSERTVIVYGANKQAQSATCLVDLEDGTVWRIEYGEPPRLVPVPLPPGERVLGVEQLQSNFRARAGWYERFGVSDRLALVGERSLYVYQSDAWMEWSDDAFYTANSSVASRALYRVRRVGGDALEPVIAVQEGASGAELLRLDYARIGGAPAFAVGAARALALLRTPAATLLGRFGPSELAAPGSARELQLRGAGALWWLHVLIALLLARDARKQLMRSPGDASARALWLLAILATGFAAWVACRAIEPRAAPAGAEPSAARKPLALLLPRAV
jgi:hypothetical protein